jgi:hypothetical protein
MVHASTFDWHPTECYDAPQHYAFTVMTTKLLFALTLIVVVPALHAQESVDDTVVAQVKPEPTTAVWLGVSYRGTVSLEAGLRADLIGFSIGTPSVTRLFEPLIHRNVIHSSQLHG